MSCVWIWAEGGGKMLILASIFRTALGCGGLGAGVAKKLGVGKAIDETLIGGGAAMGSRADNGVVFMGLLDTVE